jgi:hypothetical protein
MADAIPIRGGHEGPSGGMSWRTPTRNLIVHFFQALSTHAPDEPFLLTIAAPVNIMRINVIFFHRTNKRRNKMPVQPTEKEEEYFALLEFERLKKLEQAKQQKLAVTEKERLKNLHYMQCPKCGMHLVEIEYRGIKIDRCSDCEGIWLDKGELPALSNLGENVLGKLFSVFKK